MNEKDLKRLIVMFVSSLSLADDMGDVWHSASFVLQAIGGYHEALDNAKNFSSFGEILEALHKTKPGEMYRTFDRQPKLTGDISDEVKEAIARQWTR